MPKCLVTSTQVLWDEKTKAPYDGLPEAIAATAAAKIRVLVASMHAKPDWFDAAFPGAQFLANQQRQKGKYLVELMEINKGKWPNLSVSDCLVLGASDVDFFMAVNSRVPLLTAGWAPLEEKAKRYGAEISDPSKIAALAALIKNKKPWFFSHQSKGFEVFALTGAGNNNSGARTTEEQLRVNELRDYVKQGAELAPGVQLHLTTSVVRTPSLSKIDIYSYYPSSQPQTDDEEIMGAITHKLRVHLGGRQAKVGEPLFVRHAAATKRSRGGAGDRTDPTEQLMTLHLNPAYKKKLREGAAVAVLDDFLTYGCSFGVAKAFLRAAGAESIHCIAIGKYGGRARDYEIEITGNVFAPLGADDFEIGGNSQLVGSHEAEAQQDFLKRFAEELL